VTGRAVAQETEEMGSSGHAKGYNWLGEFVAGAVRETQSEEPDSAARILPARWMELVDGPSPEKAIGPIGPYRIERRIGRGGMGVVFQAFEPALIRTVAIKFLTPRLAAAPLARARFSREGQAAAAIKHPNVVTIHAIGEHEGLPYLVMEYIDGITLAHRLEREGMLERKSILRIGLQVARGLAAAHEQGLVHRDIKPANILLEGGLDQVKITDFGLASIATEPWRLTASGVLLGTPAYMSPEQATLSAIDHRADLFSLGSVLYHMCTGELPFPGPTLKSILTGVREAEPRPIRDLNPDIPVALQDLIRRLMAKDPADRYQSARELVGVLADELAEIQGRTRRPSRENQEQEFQPPEVPTAAQEGGQLDLVDSWDDTGRYPRTKDHATTTLTASGLSIARRAVPVIGVAIVVTIIALAIIWSLPKWWRDFGKDTPSILLLALTGIAVFTWSLGQLVTAVRRHAAADSAKRRRVGVLRNALATAILLPTAGTAYLELSAYAQSRRALNAVNARQLKGNSAPPTRKEVEALIGRTAEDLPAGTMPNPYDVTYRWKGVFRTYALGARYLPTGNNMRDPRASPAEGEGESDTLDTIIDVLE
jgi:serine/threonine protein kinase